MSGFVTETTYNQGQAAQDTKINAAQTAADKAAATVDNFSVPVNLDLVHGAAPSAAVQTTEDYFTLTVQIANPAFSSDRTSYTVNANNIDDISLGYRVFILTSDVAGGIPRIVTSTLAETPTLSMSGDNKRAYGTLKVKGTRPANAIVAVYYGGCIAGQITYEVK